MDTLHKFGTVDPQSFLWLGRSDCLLGKPDLAVDNYRIYISKRQNNPLGYLELASAMERTCHKILIDGFFDRCSDSNINNQLNILFAKAGISQGQLASAGDDNFAQGNYRFASIWYDRAVTDGLIISKSQLFKWGLSSAVTSHNLPILFKRSDFPIFELTDNLSIQAKDLLWDREMPNYNLSFGDPLSKFQSADKNMGTLWWDGQAIAFVNVKQAGDYTIMIRAQDISRSPIQLDIELDLSGVVSTTLSGVDMSWHEINITRNITKGIHLIGVSLLQDTGDAVLDSLILKRIR
jgi:hypothetical protein